MTWLGLGILVVGNFAIRMLGVFVLGDTIGSRERFTRLLGLLPLAIVAAVVAIQTFATKQDLTIDARVVGVAFAAFAAWRRMPLVVVVIGAAVTTALVRQLGWG